MDKEHSDFTPGEVKIIELLTGILGQLKNGRDSRKNKISITKEVGPIVVMPQTNRDPTPIQLVIRAFKVAKGINPDNSDWDRKFFARYAKPAKELIAVFDGNHEKAMQYIIIKADEWNDKIPSWGLDGIIRNAASDYTKLQLEEQNGQQQGEVVPDSLLGGPQRSKGIAHAREIAMASIRPAQPDALCDGKQETF